jgi:hypothetical protein
MNNSWMDIRIVIDTNVQDIIDANYYVMFKKFQNHKIFYKVRSKHGIYSITHPPFLVKVNNVY